MSWAETGAMAPERPKAMQGRGFGSPLLNRAVPMQLRGAARAESGDGIYRYELTAALRATPARPPRAVREYRRGLRLSGRRAPRAA